MAATGMDVWARGLAASDVTARTLHENRDLESRLGPLILVRCDVRYCSAVRDLRRLPPPSLGVSSLDLGRLLASGPFSCPFAECLSDGKLRDASMEGSAYSAAAR